MSGYTRFVGIDIAKATLDVSILPSGESFAVANDPVAIREVISRVDAPSGTLVILETTGDLESSVATACAECGLAVAVVNPRHVRAFARATGALAKTDTLDAGFLALFGERVRPPVRPLPD